MPGKCYSKVNRGQRKASDFYQTPFSMTEKLLEVEHFDRGLPILEPCRGDGAIVEVLVEKGYKQITSYDITDGTDFLETEEEYGNLITNPPYSLAKEFILHAMDVTLIKIAMLLPLSYLHGKNRYETFFKNVSSCPLTRIHVFTRCPMLNGDVRLDGKYNTGMQIYAWYIWEKINTPQVQRPTIAWIDNNEDVLRK